MAGSSVADFDHILSFRFKGKVFIECCHAVGFCLFDSDLFRHISKQFSRQITIFCLNILHDRNQGSCLAAVVFDNLIRFLVIRLIQHVVSSFHFIALFFFDFDNFPYLFSFPSEQFCANRSFNLHIAAVHFCILYRCHYHYYTLFYHFAQ